MRMIDEVVWQKPVKPSPRPAEENLQDLPNLVRKYRGRVLFVKDSGLEATEIPVFRDWIQSAIDAYGWEHPAIAPFRQQIEETDELLRGEYGQLLVKEMDVDYPRLRKLYEAPLSHWWWYLDKLEVPDYDVVVAVIPLDEGEIEKLRQIVGEDDRDDALEFLKSSVYAKIVA